MGDDGRNNRLKWWQELTIVVVVRDGAVDISAKGGGDGLIMVLAGGGVNKYNKLYEMIILVEFV